MKNSSFRRLASSICLMEYMTTFAQSGEMAFQDLTTRNFPLFLPETPLIVGKQLDPKTGAIRFVSQSSRIRTAGDLVKMEAKEFEAEYAKHGALGGILREDFYKLHDSEWVDVKVYLRRPSMAGLDPETHTLAEQKDNARQINSLKPIGSLGAILARFSGGLKNVQILDSGVFNCRMSKAQINVLRFNKVVGEINYGSNTQPAAYPFSSMTNSSYNPAFLMPSVYKGQGVNAATFETGLSNSRFDMHGLYYPYGNIISCLGNLNGSRIQTRQLDAVSWPSWRHSHQTFKCLWQTAPYANLFHAQFTDGWQAFYSYPSNYSFIVNNAIQTASLSYSRSTDYFYGNNCSQRANPTIQPVENAHGAEMVKMDEWAFRYPYPVFCTPTANWGTMYEANWQCYNALSVGNVRHTNLSTYEIPSDAVTDVCQPAGACTQTRNPPKLWDGPDLRGPLSVNGVSVYAGYSGDREMPYIVAPGTSPASTESMYDQGPNCLDGPMWCGTSYSAPLLNGIAACVISADSRLVSRPHKVWAVLLATAENVDGGYWDRLIDGKDGAGAVSGSSAVGFASNHNEPGPNSSAVINGLASANLSYTTPNGSTAKYNILVPNPMPSGKHLRVVLTWTSNPVQSSSPVSSGFTNWLSDLDLSVSHNSGYAFSNSYNGNVEMVDIPPSQLTPGATYKATISLLLNRIPSLQTTGTYDMGISHGILKYALAWTWVKNHSN